MQRESLRIKDNHEQLKAMDADLQGDDSPEEGTPAKNLVFSFTQAKSSLKDCIGILKTAGRCEAQIIASKQPLERINDIFQIQVQDLPSHLYYALGQDIQFIEGEIDIIHFLTF